jgi:RNA polymerase sigma-70 factor (sigma-E family)
MTAEREEAGRAEWGRLGELYRRHAEGALRLAYLLTGDLPLAEDIVQDAFVKLARRLAHIRDPDAFPAYLRRTVVNLANSRFRRERVERAYLQREKGMAHPDALEEDLDEREDLWVALQQLTARQRAALVLRFYEDLPERQAAKLLRCRPGTVKSLVSRALAALQLHLAEGARWKTN